MVKTDDSREGEFGNNSGIKRGTSIEYTQYMFFGENYPTIIIKILLNNSS